MGHFSCRLPDDFLDAIARLESSTDESCHACCRQAARLLEHVQRNLHSVLSGESTGELERSLGLSPAKIDRDGSWNANVGFEEPRSDGESNAKIANILEFGKHGQPPRSFLKPAKSAARGPAIKAMKRALESEIDGL
jgi:hypothetical protein